MAEKRLKIWYDKEGDFLEVMFEQRPGVFRETANPHVMEKVDENGNVLGAGSVVSQESCPRGDRRTA